MKLYENQDSHFFFFFTICVYLTFFLAFSVGKAGMANEREKGSVKEREL